ncbi:MAG TPA: hydroxymethylpyrimidine/phosphomethylpyrimidine kinase, partial [Gammaproteobacteria bacterium]
MNTANDRPPVVLAISGHDPTGAAGVQADIEAVAHCGARC